MAGQRGPRPQSQRGDVTGTNARVLAEEAENAVEERRGELGMMTHANRVIKDTGIIDMTDSKRPVLEGTEIEIDTSSEPTLAAERAEPVPEGRNINTGSNANVKVMELPQPEAAKARGPMEAVEEGRENDPIVVQSLFDLEDITLGYGNDMSLKSGYRYKLPRWMAEHLESRGVVNVLTYS